MKLKTRVFELSSGGYQSLPKLAQSMEVSYGMAYRMRGGKHGIHEKFIIGAIKAFPGYKLDDLLYVSEKSQNEGKK